MYTSQLLLKKKPLHILCCCCLPEEPLMMGHLEFERVEADGDEGDLKTSHGFLV